MRRGMGTAGLALLVLVSAACSSSDSTDTTAGAITTVTTEAATTTDAATTTAAPAEDSCVTCHTDEDSLRALAMEPVAEEVLSEGEG